MKPNDCQDSEEHNNVTGDVIGDTAYSERFVLKLLLKLADLEKLKDEVLEKTFEDDLCTLWDMTAERDVVLFLLKHDVLNLLSFAWPVFESARIVEIVVGVIANMCCQKEAQDALLKMETFVAFLVEYSKSDDSLVIIQVLRLINSSLYLAEDTQTLAWMRIFVGAGYSNALYYVLKNSSKKDLLITALENFNTICSCCNIDQCRRDFFGHFVTTEALECLSTAFSEITNNQKYLCQKDELERILIITLQILLNLVGFEKTTEIFSENKVRILKIISYIFTYYEKKFVTQKEIDLDLVDIIESTKTIITILGLSEISNLDTFFLQSFNMWKILKFISNTDKSSSLNFEVEDKEELQNFSQQMKNSLSNLIAVYMNKCSEDNVLKVVDKVSLRLDYEEILCSLQDPLLTEVKSRLSPYHGKFEKTESISR
ncbi:uncharacterized protein LOC121729557 [Aricia agestis]|uniref:uncharacterized protein LOC121729557 n=1 Tax=Aricia agestis TaxID=91739 RepID=UPI001C202A41|nr:uncharacterized protein LOC121729557 [Aricia agestis]